MFITFEGLDSSGKSTQASLLVDHLKHDGKRVLFLREPGGTPVSEKIRAILLERRHGEISEATELFLFSAARAQLVDHVIVPALRDGQVVVCDRFYDSTTAYQGYGRGLPLKDIRSINRLATSGRAPDITFFIDVSIAELVRRRRDGGIVADRMESSGVEFYERVLNGYRSLAAEEPQRIIMIDGMQPVETIARQILQSIQQRSGVQ